MMPIWSPGFYRVENYAGKVRDMTATDTDRKTLTVEQPEEEPLAGEGGRGDEYHFFPTHSTVPAGR